MSILLVAIIGPRWKLTLLAFASTADLFARPLRLSCHLQSSLVRRLAAAELVPAAPGVLDVWR